MAEGERDFLGAGLRWPVAPRAEDGVLELASYEDRVRQSILLILGTARGERVMRPGFGCGAHDLVFGPNSTATASRVSFEVREALLDFEPRIEVEDVRVAREGESRMVVSVDYRVRRTNNQFNLVYPFYLERGGR